MPGKHAKPWSTKSLTPTKRVPHFCLRNTRAGRHLNRVIKRKLKKIQYRPHLITGCLPTTGLNLDGLIDEPDFMISA
ncbi:hypothetical protein ACFPH6_32645 [Streptomyces xiangluensis]|uniref:Uncharacterized protein n=1 Tax=Streptomyces xiangluensis TaxID=2665720 RepID=A0ABV8YVB9_9ACTN